MSLPVSTASPRIFLLTDRRRKMPRNPKRKSSTSRCSLRNIRGSNTRSLSSSTHNIIRYRDRLPFQIEYRSRRVTRRFIHFQRACSGNCKQTSETETGWIPALISFPPNNDVRCCGGRFFFFNTLQEDEGNGRNLANTEAPRVQHILRKDVRRLLMVPCRKLCRKKETA